MSPRRGKEPKPSHNGHAPARPAPDRMPVLARLLAKPDPATPHPPVGRSVLRGLGAVAWSLPTLVTAFVLVPVLWLGLLALGFEGPIGRLASLVAIPPLSTYTDALNATAIFGYGTTSFLATAGFLVVRAVVSGVLAGLALGALEGWTWRLAVLRGIRAIPAAAISALLGLSVLVVGSVIFPLLGPGLGFLGSILALVAALLLFVHGPIAAVIEPLPAFEAVRKGMRAATMPGSRHLLLSVLYFFVALPLVPALAPQGSDLGVNPSLAAWLYALVATWVHVGFLAAFAFRYATIRDLVPPPA
ncbi:MAG: hypothetical protein ACKOKE_05995, partial [Actinomycetota bacterium]